MTIPFDPAAERAELADYLGERFDERALVDYEGVLEREFEQVGDEARLYRTSEAYLYNLTAFAMTDTKVPYLEALVHHLPPPARVLDYGCGIGSDGLKLAALGYDVAFADFDNPSTAYLRWRLERRGMSARVFDLDRDSLPGGYDLAYAFDVIEHVDDPFGFLGAMEEQADRVLVNFLDPVPGETGLHHTLPVGRLVAHASQRGLWSYHRLHGRSHLVLYGGAPRWRSALALMRGRLQRA